MAELGQTGHAEGVAGREPGRSAITAVGRSENMPKKKIAVEREALPAGGNFESGLAAWLGEEEAAVAQFRRAVFDAALLKRVLRECDRPFVGHRAIGVDGLVSNCVMPPTPTSCAISGQATFRGFGPLVKDSELPSHTFCSR
jgi:hypothetical protein